MRNEDVSHVVSGKRVTDHGAVYTGKREVSAMLLKVGYTTGDVRARMAQQDQFPVVNLSVTNCHRLRCERHEFGRLNR